MADRYAPMVLTAAITGGDVIPSQSPYIPCGAKQIMEDAVRAAEAGATCVHLHAREENGRPTSSGEVFAEIADGIRERCDVVINITTGGAIGMSEEQRLEGIRAARPELCTFNLGTMNYELFPDRSRWPEVQHDWERELMEESGESVLVNSLGTQRRFAEAIYELGITPELEAYDLGHIHMARYLLDEGTLRPPVRAQLVLGVLGAAGNSLDDLFLMKQSAERILGDDLIDLGVAAVGYPMQFRHVAAALSWGMPSCRVGLEDSIRVRRDRQATSNAELVEVAVKLADLLGRPIATPAQLRERLGQAKPATTSVGA
jgi:uncharacterized protein (DUF849 family)